MNIGFCGPDCPMHPYAFRNDDTLKVTHHYDQKQLTVTLKLLGILASSLLLIGLMVTGLGISGSGCFDTEDVPKIDWIIIKKFLKILSLLLIIFTLIFFTFFGCFLVLNNFTSWTAQTVTLSSEGAAKMYPHSMGEYQIAGGYWSFGIWYDTYHHVQLEDRFLMYNKRGKIESHK